MARGAGALRGRNEGDFGVRVARAQSGCLDRDCSHDPNDSTATPQPTQKNDP
jgi:hypothetical protein